METTVDACWVEGVCATVESPNQTSASMDVHILVLFQVPPLGTEMGLGYMRPRVFKCGNHQFWFKYSEAFDIALNSWNSEFG